MAKTQASGPCADPARLQAWYLEMVRHLNTIEPDRPLPRRLARGIGRDIWYRCTTEWRAATCRSVDRAAQRLEAAARQPSGSLSAGSPAWLGWLGVDTGGRGLAGCIVDAVSSPPQDPDPQRTAYALRVYGVAICLVRFGLLGFEHCACAAALAAEPADPHAVAESLAALPAV
ncbi:MAG: hypothetical protein ACRDVE_08220 [Actinocrinis sp.]